MDPLGDFLTRIKNAGRANKASVSAPHSKLKEAVAAALTKRGFVKSYATKNGKKSGKGVAHKMLEVELAYSNGECRVHEVNRMSLPSKRMYIKVDDIHQVRQGLGALVLSTPKGILTDGEARKERVGGEALFKIW